MRKNKEVLGLLEKRRTPWERAFFHGMTAFLIIWCAIIAIMLGWALMTTFKTNLEYVNEPLSLPKEQILQTVVANFQTAIGKLNFNGVDFWGMVYNSVWQVVCPALISIAMHIVTGYIFAHYQFPGRNLMFAAIVFIMIIPIYGAFTANYKLIMTLKMNNSYSYLLTAFGGFGGNFLLTYGYFKGVPKELREAVYIDGGSDLQAFIKVYFPLSRNIFIALFILAFIAGWNNYETALLYFDKMPNLALGLYQFQQEIIYAANQPAYFAGAIILMLPVVLVFVLFADKIMGQLYSGGIKG